MTVNGWTFDQDGGWSGIVTRAAGNEEDSARVKAAADRALAIMHSESGYELANAGNAGDPRHMDYFRLAARLYKEGTR